jgi:aldehyde dehydrogenase
MNASLDESAIRSIVDEVLGRLDGRAAPATVPPPPIAAAPAPGKDGVFTCAKAAASAAHGAFVQLRRGGWEARARVVEIVKTLCRQNAEAWGKLELDETKIGRLDHKIEKLQIVRFVPGTEWIRPYGMSGDHGISMEEHTPFGVVAAITPSTHSIPTLSGNIINIVAAGNAVVFNPHPGAARCAAHAVQAYNQAIRRETGIDNLVCTVLPPTLDSFNALCQAPEVRLLCVTGGPGVVAAAMKSGKRALCAGPGNPPAVVDACASPGNAARDIIRGAAYDNNLLCIGEKECFVVESIANAFMEALERHGGARLTARQLETLTAKAFTAAPGKEAGCAPHPVLNRDVVGRDAAILAEWAGLQVPSGTQILFAETNSDHPFVIEEQMCPVLPIVRVKNIEEAIEAAAKAEHGYKHSAMIHSLNVAHMTAMLRALDTTIFVKNGPCMAGLGLGGEGYLSYSICTTTGEGITTPLTFTRTRRCVMVDQLQIF